MTSDLPAELGDAVARIGVLDESTAAVPPDVTGVLAELLGWWLHRASDRTLSAVDVAPGPADATDPGHDCDAAPDAAAAVLAGIRAADRAVDSGATLLVPRTPTRDPLAARTLFALLTRKEASAVVPQPEGMADRDWMDTCAAVRDRAAALLDDRGQPLVLLTATGAHGIAFVTGVLLGGAARRTPCLIDGTDELAAALVADRLAFRARAWWLAASDSPDNGRSGALERMGLTPVLALRTTDEDGRAARAVLALLEMLLD